MKQIIISKGLNLPIAGAPKQQIEDAKEVNFFEIVGPDYVGMKPTLHVQVGDVVKLGQLLFEDKKTAGVKYTSPVAGTVREIRRGEKRAFLAVRIEKNKQDKKKTEESVQFAKFTQSELLDLTSEKVRDQLVESGLWTALRSRPYSKVPSPNSKPSSLFVTAMDSNPLAPSAELIISEKADDFVNGLKILSKICGKKIYLCKSPDSKIPGAADSDNPLQLESKSGCNCKGENCGNLLETVTFAGPHPAGLPGTHIHFLDPVSSRKAAWYIGYQDVIAVGQLFTTGVLPTERVVAISGPKVNEPTLVRTRLGACIDELVAGKLNKGPNRVISGSVLSGRTACGDAVKPEDQLLGLGRYHNQITVITEVDTPELFGWTMPGIRKFSLTRTVASCLLPLVPFRMSSCVYGGHRAVYPMSQFEKVMPLDIYPAFLFQALENVDIEKSEQLGCLELDEEDLALCTFADPGKNDYGKSLRTVLDMFLKEETAVQH
ncbi:MAG: Na(+)-translocating NADH-quinone reductase subunit A [Thermoguttaceae bacterium]